MPLEELLALARKHVGFCEQTEDSARQCLADAITARDHGFLESSRHWALRSLRYSVGILHPDYVRGSAVA